MARKPSTNDSAQRSDIWMPIYWGDYARDTGHLSDAHHGAYLMLIKHYWVTGAPLPDDDELLSRIACAESLAKWRKRKPVIMAFFYLKNGLWHHKRVDQELALAAERSAKGRAAANKRWGNQPDSQNDASAYARASIEQRASICPDDANHNPPLESPSSRIGTDPAREAQRAEGARLARSPGQAAMDDMMRNLANKKRVTP